MDCIALSVNCNSKARPSLVLESKTFAMVIRRDTKVLLLYLGRDMKCHSLECTVIGYQSKVDVCQEIWTDSTTCKTA